jgi:hypothetical protein
VLKRVFDENGNQRCNKCFQFKKSLYFRYRKDRDQIINVCRKCENEYHRKYYKKYGVSEKKKIYYKEYCIKHEKRLKKYKKEHSYRINRNIKYVVLLYYSNNTVPECSCCKESILDFLGIDHIYGRKNDDLHLTGNKFYRYLLKQKFPFENELQVLCHNCNLSKRNKTKCIHSRKLNILTTKEKWYKNLKYNVMKHYSVPIPHCKCCGENELEFLTIDHIYNNGKEHRKSLGSGGKSLYDWLKKNNYPEGYDVLCMNCNMNKRFNEICSHQNLGIVDKRI